MILSFLRKTEKQLRDQRDQLRGIKDNGDDIKGLFIRRFKKDIQDQAKGGFKERYIAEVPCTATPKEEAALEAFLTYESMLPKTESGRLRDMTFKKAIFSTMTATMVKAASSRPHIFSSMRKNGKKRGRSVIWASPFIPRQSCWIVSWASTRRSNLSRSRSTPSTGTANSCRPVPAMR